MRQLAEAGIGFDAGGVRVPIVPAAVIFDLLLGQPAWPDAEMGRRAASAASAAAPEQGSVGAGTGATVGKALGMERAMRSGIGTTSVSAGGAVVGALVVANAAGDVVDPGTGAIIAGTRHPTEDRFADSVAVMRSGAEALLPLQQTTLAVVATDAALTPEQAGHVASVAHDGLARTIRPVHTMFDGDTVFALATGDGPPPGPEALTRLGVLAVEAVERATLNAVRFATPAGGLPAAAAG
jgi:L-aminopeptidase/D-esterase-like protein